MTYNPDSFLPMRIGFSVIIQFVPPNWPMYESSDHTRLTTSFDCFTNFITLTRYFAITRFQVYSTEIITDKVYVQLKWSMLILGRM